ncbi:MAG: PHP domain-containing protein [Eubacteriaceae bacterium]|nr:PHP domain-containing protein [Eubacteriaceae bacterium]
MARQIDMHMHTVASDGSLYAREMADAVIEVGLGAACVADHDTLSAVDEFASVLSSHGIATVNAVEYSSCFYGRELHILAYGFPEDKLGAAESFGARCRSAREEKDRRIIHMLSERFPQLSADEYDAFSYDRHLKGGNRAAKYVYSKGVCSGYSEYSALKKSLGLDDSLLPPAEETIAFIRDAGALSVLAHPGSRFGTGREDREKLELLVEWGIMGIECLSPYNPDRDQYEYYRAFCRRHSLCSSAGSDSHGPTMSRRIGVPYADDGMCDILERLEI